MTDSQDIAISGKARSSHDDPALRARSDRLNALRAAWGVLAPSGLSMEKQEIGDVGRTLSEDLTELFGKGPSSEELAAIDAQLDTLECEMRAVALKVPVVEL